MKIYIYIIGIFCLFFTCIFFILKHFYISKNLVNTFKPKEVRVIISMTTSPKRISKISECINSLENQTIKPDLYFINLPNIFKRNGSTFSDIPKFLIKDNIILNFCEDLGPATKIVPTCKNNIVRENDIIFSVDDDINYPDKIIELYLKYHTLYPNHIISGYTSYLKKPLKKHGDLSEIFMLEGFSCVLYKKRFLENIPLEMFDKTKVPIYHYLADDLVLSNYLASKKIGILGFGYNHPIIKDIKPLYYGYQEDALHKGADGLSAIGYNNITGNNNNYNNTAEFLKKSNSYYLPADYKY